MIAMMHSTVNNCTHKNQ